MNKVLICITILFTFGVSQNLRKANLDPKIDDKIYGEETWVKFKQENYDIGLFGRLVVPQGISEQNPGKVVLIIAGSGPTDLNGNGFPSKATLYTNTYKYIAQSLESDGIASLRYNKRGLFPSYSTMPESVMTFDDMASDAARFIKFLQEDKRFNEFYIFGHSEGSGLGMLAITQYLQQGEIKGYASLEGASIDAGTLILQQLKPQLPSDVFIECVHYVSQLQAGNNNVECYKGMIQYNLCSGTGIFRPSVRNYEVSWFQFYPTQTFSTMTFLNNLVVQGTTDIQVPLKQGLQLKASNSGAQYFQGTEMNHILKVAPANISENIATYTEPQLPLFPNLGKTLSDFVNQ